MAETTLYAKNLVTKGQGADFRKSLKRNDVIFIFLFSRDLREFLFLLFGWLFCYCYCWCFRMSFGPTFAFDPTSSLQSTVDPDPDSIHLQREKKVVKNRAGKFCFIVYFFRLQFVHCKRDNIFVHILGYLHTYLLHSRKY